MTKSNSKRQPWMKFFTSDWRADPGLRMCSYAARGLWADMLSLMHEAEQYGHLIINGVVPQAKDLSAILGGTEKEISALLEMLEAKRVFSRTADGVIYSRRMLRDDEKEKLNRENGSRGGNPNLKGRGKPKPPTPFNGSDNHTINGHDNGGVNPQDNRGDKAQKPEARSQTSPLTPTRNFSGMDGAINEPGTGRTTVNGFYLDVVAERVVEIAKIDPARWRGDYQPVIAWLRDGIFPETIYAAVKRVASRPDYNVPFSLKFFERAVREQPQEIAA